MLELNDGRSELWQWDTGRTLTVDTDCSQVHFSNKVFGRSIDVNVADGVAIIPDVLLQTDKDLNVWAFSGTAENGYTKISKTFKVNRRNKPADYVFTPVEQTTIDEIAAIAQSVRDDADAGLFDGKPGKDGRDGADGSDGGYYTPSVTQPDANTMRLSFIPSKDGMTAVSETYITLPSGGSGSVAIDSTLTVSGQAADAKAVGDAINRVNSAIEAKQDHLTEQDKQEIVLTGITTYFWTDEERKAVSDRLTIIKNSLDTGIAVAGAQYYLGERKTVSIVLPDDAVPGDMITVSWYNGDTAATLSITGTMLSFDYTPSANTRSEINALWDGTYWAVLGNEMAVPSEVTA